MDPNIQHVIVLMLENRSFDSMLGRLYPKDSDYGGITLNESNSLGMTYGVWNDCNLSVASTIPDPDPGEAFTDMNEQIFGNKDRRGLLATMTGFASNYSAQRINGGYADPGAVMHYFTSDQVPAISTLASSFGVCDQWFASAPCQTWPNRFFVHTGTALGYVDNHTFKIPFEAPSIFRRLEDCGRDWRVYFHDMPQSMLIRDVWASALSHYRLFKQFLADANAGALPAYSFIEPRYFPNLLLNQAPNDEHPPHNVLEGEVLIATVYNALRASRCWKNSLLIITYDEHGGCYDHVKPPTATPPDNIVNNDYQFCFDTFGVRVPAVIVSPWIPPGTKVRVGRPIDGVMPTPFDHTSIIRTLRDVFGLGSELTQRDAAAPSLLTALSLQAPNNDGPLSLPAGLPPPSTALLVSRASATPNGMQSSLGAAASILQLNSAAAGAIPESVTPQRPVFASTASAQSAATSFTQQFLRL